MLSKITWNSRPRGKAIYLTRHDLPEGAVQPLHCHDFAELFRAREGMAIHLINGREDTFRKGELIMLRPTDTHELRVPAGGHIVFDLVAFSERTLSDLQERLMGGRSLFWNQDRPQPVKVELSILQARWMDMAIDELARNTDSQFLLERFLLNMAFEILDHVHEGYQTCPPWLRRALHELKSLEHARKGPRVLAVLTGHSQEYVARVLRRCTGLTPTDAVNRARLEHAAARLLLTDQPILDVALDCGFSSLGYFYKLFREQHHESPRRYRMEHRRLVTGQYPPGNRGRRRSGPPEIGFSSKNPLLNSTTKRS